MIELYSAANIDEGAALEFVLESGKRIFVVRKEYEFHAYINNCPHAGWPLNLAPNVFLDVDKQYIQCSNHMALFEIPTGKCVAGPCPGETLEAVNIEIINGALWLKDQI